MANELAPRLPNATPPANLAGGDHQVVIPAVIADAGEHASYRFFEFFTADIRNPRTRRAYFRACLNFFAWVEKKGFTLTELRPPHVAAYVEELLADRKSRPTVKQALAALKRLFDWLVVGQVVPFNPAAAVRGPQHIVKKGKTPILSRDEMQQLFKGIDTSHVVGLRDRALIAVMYHAVARVGATVAMRVEDYYPKGRRSWVRLHEKGGKEHEMPASHNLEAFLDAYIEAAKLSDDRKGPLFRTTERRTKKLTDRAMTAKDAWGVVRRRARDAGIRTAIGCHSFRATGITNYLENGGTLEKAQQMAAHESAKTTKLYDRTEDVISLDEVERIAF